MKRKILLVALIIVFVLSITLAACEKNYNATFETNGGSAVESDKISTLNSAPVTTREGYTFMGWYLTSDFSDAGLTYPYTLKGDTTFYAKWQQKAAPMYLVNFNTNGGTPAAIPGRNCSVVETAPEVSKEGFTLAGWYDNADFNGDPVTFPYTLTKETILHAKWEKKQAEIFRVNFNTHGGDFVEELETSRIEEEPVTTREGYVFVGWYDNADCTGNAIVFPYDVTQKITLHAKWEEKRADLFTVKFSANGGSTVATRQCTSIESEPVTTRLGNYRFVGWYENSNFSGSAITFPYTVTKDITLYAKWEQTGYTLSFNTMGGNAILERSNQLTVKSSDLPKPTNGNRVFAGWYLDELCTQAVGATYTLTKNTTFYAKWEDEAVIEFTIHFADGGDVLSGTIGDTPFTTTIDTTNTNSVLRNKPFVKAQDKSQITVTNPTRENAEFQGWYTSPTFEGNKITFPFTLDGNRIFYAKWLVNVKPNPTDSAQLQTYLDKNDYDVFIAGYGLLVQNSNGTVNQSFTQYAYRPDKVVGLEYLWNSNVAGENGSQGAWQPAYLDFAFKREQTESEWMVYTDSGDSSGKYQYGGKWYNAESTLDIEEACLMVYLSNFGQLDSTQFYKYDGKWYAVEDYVDEAGHLLLGNASGDPSNYNITYTQLALTFDDNGNLTDIDVKSNVKDNYSFGTGIAMTRYYYTHDISIWETDPDKVADISESQFLQDQMRPSGLYPELNPNDDNRNNAASDGVAYTTAQLQSALNAMNNFTAYYTLAGNTFNGFIYQPSTIKVNGNYGTVKYDAYDPYVWGEYTSAAQEARNEWYFKLYQNAFFLAISGSNGYSVYCDQYSYKNNLDYNQYLLGTLGAVGFNCKYPVEFSSLNANNFKYIAEGGYFEFVGDSNQLTQVGKSLFGDMDVVFPEESETESYVYLRLYMNDSKIVKAIAATRLELYGESYEFFIKEVVISGYGNVETISMPSSAEAQCILPGEELVGGSVTGLASAITNTSATNHKYSDRFAYDDGDDLGGIGRYGDDSNERDIYIYSGGVTKVNSKLHIYFKDGKLYQQYGTSGSDAKIEAIDMDGFNDDVEKANSYILWAYNMAELLDADWFYQGKDGNYYGKADYMDKLSWAIGRYSGSEQYLEIDAGIKFGKGYRWSVVLDFVSVEVYANRITSIYYSGVIFVSGSGGQHTKPFSGQATFSYDSPTVTLPVSDTPDATRPSIFQYLNADYNFSVDENGILSLTEVANATGYKAYVYNLTNDALVAEFTVTNGMDLKTVTELNVGTDVKNYRLSIQALGNGTDYLDGVKSSAIEIELSTVPKQSKPTVTLDSKTAILTVSGSYTAGTYYHYAITQNGDLIAQGNKPLSAKLDLNNLDGVTLNSAKTHVIAIYIMGEDGVMRDSETVTVNYTVPKSDGTTFLGDLFAAIDYSKSFSVSLSAQDRYRYHYFNQTYDGIELMGKTYTWLGQNAYRTLNMTMYYESSLSQGLLTFYLADPSNGYNHLYDITFKFHKTGESLVGTLTKTVNGEVAEQKQLTTGLLFAGVAAFEDDFAELEGQIDKYPHLTHRYMGDITQQSVQDAIAEFSVLEELLGCKLTYTAMQLNMGYNSDGTLSSNTCSLALAADDEDGRSLIVSFCFSSFGQNLSNKVKD